MRKCGIPRRRRSGPSLIRHVRSRRPRRPFPTTATGDPSSPNSAANEPRGPLGSPVPSCPRFGGGQQHAWPTSLAREAKTRVCCCFVDCRRAARPPDAVARMAAFSGNLPSRPRQRHPLSGDPDVSGNGFVIRLLHPFPCCSASCRCGAHAGQSAFRLITRRACGPAISSARRSAYESMWRARGPSAPRCTTA